MRTPVLLILLLLLAGCASYTEQTREIRSLYKSAAYQQALAKLDASELKNEAKNRLLYRLEKAMILQRLGENAKAQALLIEADKIADQLYTESISRTAASFIVNDAASDYAGEDYEKVAIHTQLALSFLGQGALDQAAVEARKINNKLYELNAGYDAEHKNTYAEDAFARYLSALIYEAKGEWDAAIIDYGKALDAYQGGFATFAQGVPDDLVIAYARLLKKRRRNDKLTLLQQSFPVLLQKVEAEDKLVGEQAADIVVIHELGHIATKTTSEFFINAGRQIVRFSFPIIRRQELSTYWRESGFRVESNTFVTADLAANMDRIAAQTLDERRGRVIAKSMARLIVKGSLTEEARKYFGDVGALVANVAAAVTETADTRSWTTLPEAYLVSRQRLRPGTYKIEVKTGGRLSDIRTLTLRPGQLQILQDAG